MKEHKIVVTRDNTKVGKIFLWSLVNLSKLELRKNVWLAEENPVTPVYNHDGKFTKFKQVFGFLPRKGSKQVLIITRAK